jgi:ribonuclease Z
MIRKLSFFAAALLVLATAAGIWAWNSSAGQDWLLKQAAKAAMQRPSPFGDYDGLQVFLCGTSSPIPEAGRAQACVAVLAGESLYLVDAGAGSALTAGVGQLPLERLEAVLLTHFHSDHFTALPEFNLNSWVAGRPKPLTVIGPEGVSEVVDGLNQAYRLDGEYRVAHHGPELLPPALGVMESRTIDVDDSLEFGDLTVRTYLVNHDPIKPAVAYRFEYRGRSVVISGDTILTPNLIEAATDADLLLQDALSLPIIKTLERAAAGTRFEHILADIQDYHAHMTDMAALVDESGVEQLAIYHLVPPPQNALFAKIFLREAPDGTILTEDGMLFELPAGSEDVILIDP